MTEGQDIVSSADFRIKLLEKQLAERDAEIARLNKTIETTAFYIAGMQSDLRRQIERYVETFKASLKGEMVVPVLREISHTEEP